VAMQLGITEKTVEKQVAKGMRLIAGYFYGADGQAVAAPGNAARIGNGNGHGQQQTD
jgi:hypothetical protein